MSHEASSGVSTKTPLPTTVALFLLAGAVLGALPGTLLFVGLLMEPDNSVTGMMGPAWVFLTFFGGMAGGVLGLVVGGIVAWYRKESTPQD